MLHGYCRVDSGDLDPATSEVLHDHVAWQHGSDLVIGGQRLVRQRRIAGAEDPVVPKIDVELFFHRRFDVDFGQNAESLGFECLDDAFYYGREASTYDLRDIVLHLNTSTDLDRGYNSKFMHTGALENRARSFAATRYFARILQAT